MLTIASLSDMERFARTQRWRLALMNLAIRGIDGKIEWGNSFLNDTHKNLEALGYGK